MRHSPEQAESVRSPGSPFGAIRRRVGIVLLGVMGSAAVPGCCASWSLNPNPIENARREAVNGCDNAKHIIIPEAGATVMLGQQEKGEEKVEAYLYMEPNSPLREARDHVQVFALPDDAAPWKELVMEPSGRITLRMDGNFIAIKFDCSDGGDNCSGDEIDPMALAEVQPAKPKKEAKDEDETDKEEEGEAGKADEGMEDKTPDAEEECKAPDSIFDEEGKIVLCTTPEIQAILDLLTPKLNGLPLKSLYSISRKLAKGSQWVEDLEKLIAESEAMQEDRRELSKENFVKAIKFLLIYSNPGAIPQLAEALKIELPKKAEPEAGGESDAETADEE